MTKSALITGPTSGSGRYLAHTLGEKGFHLLLVGRNRRKMLGMQQAFPPGQVDIYVADLSSLTEVRTVAKQIRDKHPLIAVFIANAGMLGRDKLNKTEEGIEETFMVNYLSHYCLLHYLLPNMSRGSYIILICSQAAAWYSVDFNDLQSLREYLPMKAYSRSKSMLQLLGTGISEVVNPSDVYVCNIDPGTFRSGIARSRGPWFRGLYQIASWFMPDPDKALSMVPDILDGKYEENPSGSLFKKGKASYVPYLSEEFHNLLGRSTILSGCDLRKSLSKRK